MYHIVIQAVCPVDVRGTEMINITVYLRNTNDHNTRYHNSIVDENFTTYTYTYTAG